MKKAIFIIATLTLAASAVADDGKPPSTGLSVFANAGAFKASNITAGFYDGRPGNQNTIERVLKSNQYGQQIWTDLVGGGYILPSSAGTYEQLRVAEYPMQMYYRITYQIGLGIRYDYSSGYGWLLRFDLSNLTADGAFNLSTNDGTLGSNQYIRCGIIGKEKRISIDLALTRTVAISNTLDLEIDLGASLVNTKVEDNIMEIAGRPYSIVDRWDGRTPDYGVEAYDNIVNQGGIGYGVFMSLLVGYRVPAIGAFKAGYTCYQTKTVLQGYTAWGWQHMLGIRIEMNNFKI